MTKIKFKEIVKELNEPWQPRDIAYINDTALRVAKIDGEYHWHTHREEDEFFYVLKGSIHVDIGSESYELKKGEGLVVKKGVRHRSRARKPAWVLLIEPVKTKTKGEESG
jgi:mannose-6-phosphate isomerase-like protein (cupin superfamily)